MKNIGKYRIVVLLAGIATASVIVFSQLFYFQAATYCQKKAETEHEKKKDTGHETYISIPSNTIASVSNIEISDAISFVLETLLENEQAQPQTETVSITNRLFHTLFRCIISPNAP
jgi:hypothetical protein